jgi:hypothetical protein
VVAPDPSGASLGAGRVAATLTVLLVLALVLPFAAVRTLHARRVDAADRDLQAIAGRLERMDRIRVPEGAELLIGPGVRPRVEDERWNSASSVPMSRAVGGSAGETPVDPWGNAYMVIVSTARRPMWVVSAGADGILQTPFRTDFAAPYGDDLAVRVR